MMKQRMQVRACLLLRQEQVAEGPARPKNLSTAAAAAHAKQPASFGHGAGCFASSVIERQSMDETFPQVITQHMLPLQVCAGIVA